MPREIDLTPFGFTSTESQAYAALLRLGPSTGYSVAHATRIARANAYGALEGLVSRTAALRLAGRPARYRATDPAALIAPLAARKACSRPSCSALPCLPGAAPRNARRSSCGFPGTLPLRRGRS